MMDPLDTIVAIASPAGPSARGIVRLSGPCAWPIAFDAFDPRPERTPRFPEFQQGELRIVGMRSPVPAMLGLWPPPRTYTGQPIAEIHLVGCLPILDRLLAHCLSRGARHAEPGEFTLRAFLSGRIDLTRAEAVLGVIDAVSPSQLDTALVQLAGGISGPILALRDRLLDVAAGLEAALDFVDEHDVESVERVGLSEELERSAFELEALARRMDDRGRPEGHPRVVLVGPPNAGKSRLFNAMLGRDRAIVSPIAGTTRDYLSGLCDCNGLIIELIDTAGIELAGDAVSAEAQEHRDRQTLRADLLIDCRPLAWGPREVEDPGESRRIQVATRCDEGGPPPPAEAIATSAVTGMGLSELRSAIARGLADDESTDALPIGTAARCRGSLHDAGAALRSASETLLAGGGDELVAFDVRLAAEELGKVVGAVVTDDILDRIFRRFCIGK